MNRCQCNSQVVESRQRITLPLPVRPTRTASSQMRSRAARKLTHQCPPAGRISPRTRYRTEPQGRSSSDVSGSWKTHGSQTYLGISRGEILNFERATGWPVSRRHAGISRARLVLYVEVLLYALEAECTGQRNKREQWLSMHLLPIRAGQHQYGQCGC